MIVKINKHHLYFAGCKKDPEGVTDYSLGQRPRLQNRF